jgi:hypothetical protein
MADNVVHIAFDADAKQQQEQLFLRLFQILDHEICRAKGHGAPQSAILQSAFHALLAAWAEHGTTADEDQNIRLFTEVERFADGSLNVTILDNEWLDSISLPQPVSACSKPSRPPSPTGIAIMATPASAACRSMACCRKAYAAEWRARISPSTASPGMPEPGDAWPFSTHQERQAMGAPRCSTFSFPRSSDPHPYTPGLAHLEGRVDPSVPETLLNMGHKLRLWPEWTKAAGSLATIEVDREHGVLHGAADARRVAYAIGR